jgi:hypothetical protein
MASGVWEDDANCTNNDIFDNEVTDATNAALSKIRLVGTGSRVRNNTGANPVGYGINTPAFPASGVDQINITNNPVDIYITGVGTGITAYGITDLGGTLTSFTVTVNVGYLVSLDPSAKIRLTYTGAPNWRWYGR